MKRYKRANKYRPIRKIVKNTEYGNYNRKKRISYEKYNVLLKSLPCSRKWDIIRKTIRKFDDLDRVKSRLLIMRLKRSTI